MPPTWFQGPFGIYSGTQNTRSDGQTSAPPARPRARSPPVPKGFPADRDPEGSRRNLRLFEAEERRICRQAPCGEALRPGKVNPVIPEVVNQICFRVIGNDLTVTFAAEAGQLQLNVMEPVLVHAIISSIRMLLKGMARLRTLCVDGITANEGHCRELVMGSIGIVTALNPTLGYENSAKIAKRALKENRSVYDLVLEEKLLTKEELDELLRPENMIAPHKFYAKK